MRGAEIIDQIKWSYDIHPESRREIEDAILRLDAKAHGGNRRPRLNSVSAFARLEAYIKRKGSARKAAMALGISESFLSDIRNARRPIPPGFAVQSGLSA
ncbi:MAG: hypothetical protein CML24_10775 [Rhizobiales bacterium]|nr:hypothetical protein [Hyphomicrobiales bacterium]|tara:strand:- start:3149 stop:3448 length:300 start_codon:yes stop_codon:yes gene_type:complete